MRRAVLLADPPGREAARAPPTAAELALEARIDEAFLRLQAARSPRGRRAAFSRMRSLIAQRSPAQVERLERERGLVR